MSPKIGLKPCVPPEQQEYIVWSQGNPVQGQWYTVMDTTPMVRLITMMLLVEQTNEDLVIQITIDGQVIGSNTLPAQHDTNYYVGYPNPDLQFLIGSTNYALYKPFLIEGRSMKIEMGKTTANGNGRFFAAVAIQRWK